jgi:flagellar biosynthesis protein FlhF
MRIRKFEASTLQQAMARVKAELGEEAVILHTRSFPGRLFGLLSKPRVEVTAALEDQQPYFGSSRQAGAVSAEPRPAPKAPEPQAKPAPRREASPSVQAAAHEFLSRIEKIRQSGVGAIVTQGGEHSQTGGEVPVGLKSGCEAGGGFHSGALKVEPLRLEALEVRIDRLTNTMERLLSIGGPMGQMGLLADVPLPWHAAMKRLMESALSEPLLAQVAARLKGVPHPGPDLETKVLRELLATFIVTSPPIEKPESGQRLISLVGPTGVGKTTTLAKLASALVVNPRVPTRVGLITVDTYRLAAEDQLRKYAEILRLDLQVVYGPEEMPEALKRCQDADVVFIDTAGRSPRDESQMAELKAFLDRAPGCEKYLVLASTMNDRYVQETVERFRPISIDSLIVTKLDETRNFAAPLNIQQLTQIPISYLTTGQNVPEDIEAAAPGRLADEILSGLMNGLLEGPAAHTIPMVHAAV